MRQQPPLFGAGWVGGGKLLHNLQRDAIGLLAPLQLVASGVQVSDSYLNHGHSTVRGAVARVIRGKGLIDPERLLIAFQRARLVTQVLNSGLALQVTSLLVTS